jgi:hypothetical protein
MRTPKPESTSSEHAAVYWRKTSPVGQKVVRLTVVIGREVV